MGLIDLAKCVIFHWRKHRTYGDKSRKCFKCGYYFRNGSASKRCNHAA